MDQGLWPVTIYN